tara:strand:- start:728 stop:1051 length:324 start_codon:yes stop_codon:yes gene_type:complete
MIKILILIIKFYKYFISPFLGSKCRFIPTCSEYFVEALNTHGLIIGFKLGVKRIFKCHPFKKLGGTHGIDFVPIPKNASRQERLKIIVEGLQRAGWKLENNKESKNG